MIQRRLKDEADDGGPVQQRLEMRFGVDDQAFDCDRDVYRAMATRLDVLDGRDGSAAALWHRCRGGCSEHRIRELRQDCAGGASSVTGISAALRAAPVLN